MNLKLLTAWPICHWDLQKHCRPYWHAYASGYFLSWFSFSLSERKQKVLIRNQTQGKETQPTPPKKELKVFIEHWELSQRISKAPNAVFVSWIIHGLTDLRKSRHCPADLNQCLSCTYTARNGQGASSKLRHWQVRVSRYLQYCTLKVFHSFQCTCVCSLDINIAVRVVVPLATGLYLLLFSLLCGSYI